MEKPTNEKITTDKAAAEEPVAPVTASATDDDVRFWGEHRLSLLLIGTILIAIFLTIVSVALYNISGAAQLDLSRPGYKSVSDKVDTNTKIEAYSSSGSVNKDSIKQFITIYDEQAMKAKGVDAFNGDPLNPEVLIPATGATAE